MKPLTGLIVLDFSQFLAGPSAALRLADLGARVIKIERPEGGDLNRQLSLKNLFIDGDSLLFHTINRNKESYAANLKNKDDLEKVKKLIKKSDVLIGNFRPGIMEKLGMDYESVKEINPRIVYGTVTGYGKEGPWRNKPGQDLLVQSLSGLAWLNGDADQPPVPMGLAMADMLTGSHLVQGILAALVRRAKTGLGSRVEVSLIESVLDLQFEVLTTYLNDGGKLPARSSIHNAHAYLAAPYGIYKTRDGYIALAMGSILKLGEFLQCEKLMQFTDQASWFERRDEIKRIISEHLTGRTTKEWMEKLEPEGYWCSEVLNWAGLFAHEGFQVLEMIQEVTRPGGQPIRTLRCPITIDGQRLTSAKASPRVGEDNDKIDREFQLREEVLK